jgi:hypothetical protein
MPSSVIRRWDYDPADQRLDVTFVTGRFYSYHAVPEAVAQGLGDAFSKGSYFNRHIRDHYAFTEHRRRASAAD